MEVKFHFLEPDIQFFREGFSNNPCHASVDGSQGSFLKRSTYEESGEREVVLLKPAYLYNRWSKLVGLNQI